MVQLLSEYLEISPGELEERGVFDGFLGIDNKLFVDPNLLPATKTPEFQNSRATIEGYFQNVIALLDAVGAKGDIAWREAAKRLIFREPSGIALGYANAGGRGNGIGGALAARLTQRGYEIVRLGIKDPLIFELIGLFEEDFGADRLSDMTIGILQGKFLSYTDRVTKEIRLKKFGIFTYLKSDWQLPVLNDGKTPLILVPSDLLNDLPVAVDRSEIGKVVAFNDQLRDAWNALFAAAAKVKRRVSKTDIRNLLFDNPKYLEELVAAYRKAPRKTYDFGADPEGLLSWREIGNKVAGEYPLETALRQPQSVADILEVLDAIVRQFKKNVEENRLYEVLYSEGGKPRKEVYSQRLFYAVADSYCSAFKIELSREPNAGNGPVDFKLSAQPGRVLVELKLSKNDLLHGYDIQLPAYIRSEKADAAIYVIIRVSDSDAGIDDVLAMERQGCKAGKPMPKVYVIDARPTESASKRKQ